MMENQIEKNSGNFMETVVYKGKCYLPLAGTERKRGAAIG